MHANSLKRCNNHMLDKNMTITTDTTPSMMTRTIDTTASMTTKIDATAGRTTNNLTASMVTTSDTTAHITTRIINIMVRMAKCKLLVCELIQTMMLTLP